MVAEKYLIRMTTDHNDHHNDNLVRDGYFVSFASFPFGSRETSGSKFGMIFNPCLKESQCKTVVVKIHGTVSDPAPSSK